MTRNLAPLASDLVDLLIRCGQAVDPNLVKLKEAYSIIQAKLQDGNADDSEKIDDKMNIRGGEKRAASAPLPFSKQGGASNASPQCHAGEDKTQDRRTGSVGDVVVSEVDTDVLRVATGTTVRLELASRKNCMDEKLCGSKAAKGLGKRAFSNAVYVSDNAQQVKDHKDTKKRKARGCSVDAASAECEKAPGVLEKQNSSLKNAQGSEDKASASEKQKRRRRSRVEKRAAADAGVKRKKSKQGIFEVPKTAEVAGFAYDSGQDSD
jgi:hypothetical protein